MADGTAARHSLARSGGPKVPFPLRAMADCISSIRLRVWRGEPAHGPHGSAIFGPDLPRAPLHAVSGEAGLKRADPSGFRKCHATVPQLVARRPPGHNNEYVGALIRSAGRIDDTETSVHAMKVAVAHTLVQSNRSSPGSRRWRTKPMSSAFALPDPVYANYHSEQAAPDHGRGPASYSSPAS